MIKCIVWDLDNTMWSGIIAEGQIIEINDKIVQYVKLFYERGIVNTICSKNDYSTAKTKLQALNLWGFFVYPQINWKSKSQNIAQIIGDLHFREQDVMFVDDNLYEIDEVKFSFPKLVCCLANNYTFLEKMLKDITEISTVEVKERNRMYKMEARRLIDREHLQLSQTDFLMSCNIRIRIRKAQNEDTERISNLTERSHQINSTGIYYDENKINEMIENKKKYDVFVGEVEDKYGGYGRSGILIAEKSNREYKILLFIISCRLLGKGITQAFFASIVNKVIKEENRYNNVSCFFCRNDFNRQMVMLYNMNGFGKRNSSNNTVRYEYSSHKEELEIPKWVEVFFEEEEND